MGRQFSFFLGPDDVAPFWQTLSFSQDIVFLHDRPLSSEPKILSGMSQDSFRTLLTRKTDLHEIKFRAVPTQPFFATDTFSQNIIECDLLPEPYNGFLREGRLYYAASYWNENNEKIRKPDEFLCWSQSLFRRTKKSLTKVDSWFYAGKHALRMRGEGIKFNQLDGWAWRSDVNPKTEQEVDSK